VPARLLALFAHPRDAAILVGGTLARYAEAGSEIILLSATRGEAAPAARPTAANDELRGVRSRELHVAGRILGLRDLVLLDYPDGGLQELDPEVLEDLFFDLIRAVEPEVVVTFGRDGLDGDPDHQAVHVAAAGAFFRARALAADAGTAPAKLYYTLWPEQHGRRARRLLEDRGIPASAIPSLGGASEGTAGVSTLVDVRATLARKLEAVRAHASQVDPAFDAVHPDQLEDLWGQEFFARAFPHPWITGVIERDLLAGLPPEMRADRLAS
jgi:LmbE family N-acetylglucosaminyl deacetylase